MHSPPVEVESDAHLLLTLREVSDLVSHSHDFAETLNNIVTHIQRRFRSDVCSVYTLDRGAGELELTATIGLRPECVNQVRMALHEGLVGLVAQRREPVNESDAHTHPRFRYFPETGEEAFSSFLGVPMIQGGVVKGVLTLQHRERRQYSASQVQLLMGVAAQIAILATNAQLTRQLNEAIQHPHVPAAEPPRERMGEFHGVPACPGVGWGKALRFEEFDFADPQLVSRPAGAVEEERARLQQALEAGRRDLDLAAEHLAELLGEQFGALMHAQRLMLEDSTVQRELHRLIDGGASVERAVVTVCREYMKAFEQLDNPFFYERIYDIKDVFRRVLDRAAPAGARGGAADPVVVVAHEVSLLELFASDLTRIRGLVVERGGAYSHVAILARSLGIPMLTQVPRIVKLVEDGDEVFVDGTTGIVALNPDEPRRQVLLKLVSEKATEAVADDPAGPFPIRLEATVNLLPEIARTVRFRAEAVGLYRSEFLQLARRSMPSEEEQVDIYRKMLGLLEGRPLTVRTVDLRAEKLFGIAGDDSAGETLWEWRLVDSLPHVQEIVRVQLRAILRAAVAGPIRILFPMIAGQRQFQCALRLLQEARRSLRIEGLPFGDPTPVGIMIEVASAALSVRRWARDVDFVGIGSNDLLHSLLGIGREDDALARLKTPLDPSYLRAVAHIVRQAHAFGKQVTVCGEAASQPLAVLALVALKVDAISAPPDDLPKLRRILARGSPATPFSDLRRRLLRAGDAADVERILLQAFPQTE